MQFEDEKGRSWNCRIDWAAMRRAKGAGVDLSKVEEHLGDFYRGSVSLIDALWAVVAKQAETAKLSLADFEAGMTGDAISRGTEALVEGLRNFFPPSRSKLIAAANDEVKDGMAELHERFVKPSTESPES